MYKPYKVFFSNIWVVMGKHFRGFIHKNGSLWKVEIFLIFLGENFNISLFMHLKHIYFLLQHLGKIICVCVWGEYLCMCVAVYHGIRTARSARS